MAVNKAGMTSVDADEFVQFCIVVPLKGEPLAWESKQLAALTAYVVDIKQPSYTKMQTSNPCMMKKVNDESFATLSGLVDSEQGNPCSTNPCAVKNPCAMNPCAAKNPCAR